jgi:hypothetical protein
MAVTIVATVAGADANSYLELEDADAYHDAHPYASTWDAATTDQKNRALVMATSLLDTWYTWKGSVVGSTQALLWPRVGVIGPNGYEQSHNAIPVRIMNGTAELARQLLDEDRTADSETEVKGLTELTVGSIGMKFRTASSKPIPDAVEALVMPYVRFSNRFGPITVQRA